jgi:hypothetical protein
MAFDPSSAFKAINTIGSLFGAASLDRQRAEAMREANRLRVQAIRIAVENAERAYEQYQVRKQRGDFDPTRSLELVGKASARNLSNAMGQSLTSLKNLGYNEGDSPFSETQRRISERALFDEESRRLEVEKQFQNEEEQALSYVDMARNAQIPTLMNSSAQIMGEAPQGNNMMNTIAALGRQYAPKQKPSRRAWDEAGIPPIGTTYGTDNYGNPVSIIPDNPNKQYPWEQ